MKIIRLSTVKKKNRLQRQKNREYLWDKYNEDSIDFSLPTYAFDSHMVLKDVYIKNFWESGSYP